MYFECVYPMCRHVKRVTVSTVDSITCTYNMLLLLLLMLSGLCKAVVAVYTVVCCVLCMLLNVNCFQTNALVVPCCLSPRLSIE